MSHRLELLAAYRNTDFTIYAPDGDLIMRCEEESDAIDELVRTFGKANCAFITAHNPGSVKLGVLENAQRHQELLHEVRFPGEPDEYRRARDELLRAELDLRREVGELLVDRLPQAQHQSDR